MNGNAKQLGAEAAAMVEALYRGLNALEPQADDVSRQYVAGFVRARDECWRIIVEAVGVALEVHRDQLAVSK